MSETSEIDRVIGCRLQICRVIAGLDKTSFAERLGVTAKLIREFESGSKRIDAQVMRKICNVLNVRTTYFFEHWLQELSPEGCEPMSSAAERSFVITQAHHRHHGRACAPGRFLIQNLDESR